MHRIGCGILAALLLCGCSAVTRPTETAEAVRDCYTNAETIAVTADIVSGLNEETVTYRLGYTYQRETDSASIEILKPDSVAGIQATVSGENFTFSYADAELETAMPEQKGMTPADVLPYLLDDIQNRDPKQVWKENGRLVLRYESSEDTGTTVKEVYLNPADYALTAAHIYRNGEQIMDCAFASCSLQT